MKTIVLFGAGKSATVLIRYLLDSASAGNWQLNVVDANISLAEQKIGSSPYGSPFSFDIRKDELRQKMIGEADLVISLLPPSLHLLVAKDCLAFGKNLLTASYVDEHLKALAEEVEQSGLLFLCELGLDPGIDHMSSKQLIDNIHEEGGKIVSFISHCGGLVAPESDDNPWHYKISWNPQNIVMAGKAGATFKQHGEIREMEYQELFAEKRFVSIPDHEALCWYPNRDSLKYISQYGLHDANTFIRTTLRHPDFIYGWKNVVDLKLTSEERVYATDGRNLASFFKQHMDNNGFNEWLENKLHEQFDSTKHLLSELVHLVKLEEEATEKGIQPVEEFMLVDEKGDLKEIDIDDLKINAATTLADKMHDANLTLKQLFYLGLNDEETQINKGVCSAAEVLQLALEKKLALQPPDKDLVVMMHEAEFEKDGEKFRTTSTLLIKGDDAKNTAMAKTVGLPLAVAARLVLDGTITATGIRIPVAKEIYEPLLRELETNGILFRENREQIK